jgi:hypothetical protein
LVVAFFDIITPILCVAFRLAYLELCGMVQLLRAELHAPQVSQVAKDFIVFAFECAGRSGIGNPEDEQLEFDDFFAVASQLPGIGHVLSVDVAATFEAEKGRLMATLDQAAAKQADAASAAKEPKADANSK